MIEVIDASAFPDALCGTTQGFINRMATKLSLPDCDTGRTCAPISSFIE